MYNIVNINFSVMKKLLNFKKLVYFFLSIDKLTKVEQLFI